MVQLERDAVPEASPQTQNVGKRSRRLQRSSCFCHTINTSVTHASSGSAQTLTKKRDQRRLRPCSWYCVYRRHGKITNCALVGLSKVQWHKRSRQTSSMRRNVLVSPVSAAGCRSSQQGLLGSQHDTEQDWSGWGY